LADSSGKRMREAKKRQQQQHKDERKRMRKAGLLPADTSGLFGPGEKVREIVNPTPANPPPPPPVAPAEPAP